MAKRILTLCLALVIGIAFAMPASAAVKSIKVGGDLTIRGIYRQHLDFQNHYDYNNGSYYPAAEAWLMSTTRVWVKSELTDNVSVVVRILNETDWTSEYEGDSGWENLLVTDLAYINMKDIFVPGLSATIGRQELLLGKGFVVGNENGIVGDQFGYIRAADLTAHKSFDAVRVDYAVGTTPITITAFDAKISETAPRNGDIDLSGVNVAYKTDNLTVEGYGLLLDNQTDEAYHLYTLGARGDLTMAGLNVNLEGAGQLGKYDGIKSMAGFAGNADVSYTFGNPMMLKVGGAWYYASGDSDDSRGIAKGSWVPLYPDNLGDRIGRITYADMINTGFGTTGSNMSVPKIYASIKPTEKITVSAAVFPFSTIVSTNANDKDLGWGINSGFSYQYTEDVALGVLVDYAHAGNAVPTNGSKDAWQAIGTVAVNF